ncbi:MAG: hypothetical protein M0P73_03190 [Syntrophobacterales bacterium]|jgi:hypothetical protein|nr:hypothetical protein [Syntrophobacterales bacterium]
MGLWLKCPGCQTKNPLSLKVCPNCGQDLVKLATQQRVYVIGPAESNPAPAPATPQAAAPAAPEPMPAAAASAPAAPAAEPAAPAKAAKKPRKTKKKKA